MDVRAYYRKIRGIESEIPASEVVVVSLETSDGGKAGRFMEAVRYQAAKMIVDGRVRLATPEEAEAYRAESAEAWVAQQARRAATQQTIFQVTCPASTETAETKGNDHGAV